MAQRGGTPPTHPEPVEGWPGVTQRMVGQAHHEVLPTRVRPRLLMTPPRLLMTRPRLLMTRPRLLMTPRRLLVTRPRLLMTPRRLLVTPPRLMRAACA